jgi:hypothetical protein
MSTVNPDKPAWISQVNERYEVLAPKDGNVVREKDIQAMRALPLHEIVRQFKEHMFRGFQVVQEGNWGHDLANKIERLSKEKLEYYQSSRFGRIKQFFSALRNLKNMGTFTSSGQLGLNLVQEFRAKQIRPQPGDLGPHADYHRVTDKQGPQHTRESQATESQLDPFSNMSAIAPLQPDLSQLPIQERKEEENPLRKDQVSGLATEQREEKKAEEQLQLRTTLSSTEADEAISELDQAFGDLDEQGLAEYRSSIENLEEKAALYNKEKNLGILKEWIQKYEEEQRQLRNWIRSPEFKRNLMENPGTMAGLLFVLQAKMASGNVGDIFEIIKDIFWESDYEAYIDVEKENEREISSKEPSEELKHKAATDIQRVFRGHLGRKKAEQLKKTKEQEASRAEAQKNSLKVEQEPSQPLIQNVAVEENKDKMGLEVQQESKQATKEESLVGSDRGAFSVEETKVPKKSSKAAKLLGPQEEVSKRETIQQQHSQEWYNMLATAMSTKTFPHATSAEREWIGRLWQALMKDASVVSWQATKKPNEYILTLNQAISGTSSDIPVGSVAMKKEFRVVFKEEFDKKTEKYKKVVSFPSEGYLSTGGLVYKAGGIPVSLQQVSLQENSSGEIECRVKAVGYDMTWDADFVEQFWNNITWKEAS